MTLISQKSSMDDSMSCVKVIGAQLFNEGLIHSQQESQISVAVPRQKYRCC